MFSRGDIVTAVCNDLYAYVNEGWTGRVVEATPDYMDRIIVADLKSDIRFWIKQSVLRLANSPGLFKSISYKLVIKDEI